MSITCSSLFACVQHNGETSVLDPPACVLSAIQSSSQSDSVSITSASSSNTTEYQRRFRMQVNPSLTDIRSMRNRLQKSIASSSTSGISSSTASSGIPGIGYLSGKVAKRVGLKILSSLEALEICRRRWLIRKFMTQIGRIPEDQLVTWLMARRGAVTRTIEDLLELTSYVACHLYCTQSNDGLRNEYRVEYQLTAANQSATLEDILYTTINLPGYEQVQPLSARTSLLYVIISLAELEH